MRAFSLLAIAGTFLFAATIHAEEGSATKRSFK
jgi:hypothetical protein